MDRKKWFLKNSSINFTRTKSSRLQIKIFMECPGKECLQNKKKKLEISESQGYKKILKTSNEEKQTKYQI